MRFLVLFLLLTLVGHAQAQFETWTNANGRQAAMQPINVIERDGVPTARFRLQNGQIVEIKISDLSDESVVRLDNWISQQETGIQPGNATPNNPDAAELVSVRGADASFDKLIETGKLQPGSNRTEGVTGSAVRVDRSRVESSSTARRRIEQEIRIHTLAHSAIPRQDFGRWTRWYQEHGNTQIFRLFEGETNVRNNRPFSARIEAFSNHNWRVGQGWHEWSGTYTIIKPHPCVIFQVMNGDNEWAVHLGMDGDGNVSVSHRRGAREVIARNMTGKPFDIKVRDNGHDFEVYLNGGKVSEGSYDRPSGQTNFRWGLYRGERPMNHDTMILVSGATVRANQR